MLSVSLGGIKNHGATIDSMKRDKLLLEILQNLILPGSFCLMKFFELQYLKKIIVAIVLTIFTFNCREDCDPCFCQLSLLPVNS